MQLEPSVPQHSFIPESSAFCRVRAQGRRALPEAFGSVFVERFAQAASGTCRDYRKLRQLLWSAANERGYVMPAAGDMYGACRKLWQSVLNSGPRTFETAAVRYTDCFILAVLACPAAEEDVYE